LNQASPPAPEGLLAPLREFAADIRASAGRAWLGLVLLIFLGSLVEGFGILLLVPLLSVVIGDTPAGSWLGEFTAAVVAMAPGDGRFSRILFLLFLFAALFAVRAWIILRRDMAIARLQTGFIQEQRLRLVALLSASRWDVLARLRHGRVTHVLGSDLDDCGNAAFLLLTATVALAILAGQLVLAFLISPLLAALILILLALGGLALRPVLRRARDLGHSVTSSNMGVIATTADFLGALKLAVSQNLQSSFIDELRSTLERARARRIEFARQRAAAQLALAGVALAVAGIAMLLGIGLLGLSPAAAIAFLFILGRMNGPAQQVQVGAQQVFHSLPAYRQLKLLQAELEAAQDAPAPMSVPIARGAGSKRVELDRATFRHGGGGGVSDISLRLETGEFVGLSGPSGAGKTTLADLLVGLYPPQSGRVFVGGEPLEGATLTAWRGSVSYVSQDPFLFHDSVRRNLLWAAPNATEPALWEALEMVGAAALVGRLEGGLDAVVGERGTLLSGGERQRIALARALLRKPSFLLLDEATSAIDLGGEREVLERLAQLPERPTIVIIAHRAESLGFCTRVLELRDGRLVQSLEG
jgi:ATP-binding cassette, subfamily C, bacterial